MAPPPKIRAIAEIKAHLFFIKSHQIKKASTNNKRKGNVKPIREKIGQVCGLIEGLMQASKKAATNIVLMINNTLLLIFTKRLIKKIGTER